MQKRLLLTIFILNFFNVSNLHAQDQDINLWGALPLFYLQGPLNDYLDYHLKLNNQINVIEKYHGDNKFPRQVSNTNFTTGIGYRYSPHLHLAANLLFRITKPFNNKHEYELRPWQQFSLTHQINKYRIRNRFRMEQRWFTHEDNFDIRLRYQLSTDFPLAGEKIDVGETYLNLSYEILSIPTRDEFLRFLNQRPYAGLGMRLNEQNRLEMGPELRTQIIESGVRRNVWFLRLTWSYII